MKCREPRLKSCCCCINLRAGCFFAAICEIIASMLGFFVGEGDKLFLIARFGFMLHLIGSIFLLMSSVLQIEVLVVVYLVTNVLHIILCTAFVIEYGISCSFCALETVPVFIPLIFSLYFWMVAFSYWRRLQWMNNPEYDD
ncbi:hypothetical protein KR009_012007 [Drosophila setifemur]|nr:hypothetical protein KR009_012007 [Drosophila setifemur]